MEENVIENASDLYKAMQDRRLDIRRVDGRDNGWYDNMCDLIGSPRNGLKKYLTKNNTSAEVFLIAFLKSAQPFSMMFTQIWDYLSTHLAPGAHETISIRFGFPQNKTKTEINLEEFRRQSDELAHLQEIVEYQIWSLDALQLLFPLSNEFDNILKNPPGKSGYSPGERMKLRVLTIGEHPFDLVADEIRNVFQQIIDENQMPVSGGTMHDQMMELKNSAQTLTDLMPRWTSIFYNLDQIPLQIKDSALIYYNTYISPLLKKRKIKREKLIKKVLDILDLPFWKHRWHTYEIWCTIITLDVLGRFKPVPRIVDGRIALDGYSREIIADFLSCNSFPDAGIVIQEQTEVSINKRKAIKPDLRICFADLPGDKNNTALVIEFKQRKTIERRYIEEVAIAYTAGAPKSAGVIIVNYDQIKFDPVMPPNSFYIENFRPDQPDSLEMFRSRLISMIASVGFKIRETNILLIDVSWSMIGEYDTEEIMSTILRAKNDEHTEVLFFNIGLVELEIPESGHLQIGGGTDLFKAIKEMRVLIKSFGRVLIVSDGDYDDPSNALENVEYQECLPADLPEHLEWLLKAI